MNERDVPVDRRGYQSTKHSTEDARERTAYQMEILKKQREEDAARAAAARAEAAAAEAAERVMTHEEKAKAKAQKEAFYFSAGVTAGRRPLTSFVHSLSTKKKENAQLWSTRGVYRNLSTLGVYQILSTRDVFRILSTRGV